MDVLDVNSLQRCITLSVAAGPVSRRAKYDTKSLPDSALDLQEKNAAVWRRWLTLHNA